MQLRADFSCAIFGSPSRPAVCSGLKPSAEMCGETREFALTHLAELETLTR